uniref:Uncharacterized protein n=1 Tax=Acrobeloides nanus TaxID=290746 RepID=A0A914DRG0_9BILA
MTFFTSLIISIVAQPWYQITQAEETATNASLLQFPPDFKCEAGKECSTTLDCSTGLSCFQATSNSSGCCLKALKPNETGCFLDDQCKRACESSHCDKIQSPARCLCDSGRHFLFNKCWKKCPEFALSEPITDEKGFSRCVLKVDTGAALNYMRRFRRQLRSAFC